MRVWTSSGNLAIKKTDLLSGMFLNDSLTNRIVRSAPRVNNSLIRWSVSCAFCNEPVSWTIYATYQYMIPTLYLHGFRVRSLVKPVVIPHHMLVAHSNELFHWQVGLLTFLTYLRLWYYIWQLLLCLTTHATHF